MAAGEAEKQAVGLIAERLGSREAGRYRRLGTVQVKGGDTGRLYEVHPDKVYLMDDVGKSVIRGFCVHPNIRMTANWPLADWVLTLALWIRGSERQFRTIANPL